MATAPPRRKTLAAREARLAYAMLLPTFIIVFAIVLFPVLANFWISFKQVGLADLRAPEPTVRERVREEPETPGDPVTVRYQLLNRSQSTTLRNVTFTDTLPEGLTLTEGEPRCEASGSELRCALGDWEGGFREDLELSFTTSDAFFGAAGDDVEGFLEAGFEDATPHVSAQAPNVLTNLTFTLTNYRRFLGSPEFWPTLRTTLLYTVFGTLGSILLGLFAAQLLNERFRGQGFLRGLFLFPYVAPVIAVAFTWAFLLDPQSGSVNALGVEFGLLQNPISFLSERSLRLELFGLPFTMPLALTAVILFEAWRYFPFAFLFILARFQAIPQDMYEAADVDGASPLQKFWWVTLPQLVGILSTLFLLRFIWTFNKFDDIFLLSGGAAGTKTLTIAVYDEAFARADLGAGAAASVVLFVILGVFMVLYFRFAPDGEQ